MNINATLFAQLIVFGLLVMFTMKFIWPPIVKALDERANKIAEGLAAAERGQNDFREAEQKVEGILAEGRNQVAERLSGVEKRAQQLLNEATEKASDEAARLIADARGQIEQETIRAKEALREQVAVLAVAGAEKILRHEIDAQKHADILSALKQEL